MAVPPHLSLEEISRWSSVSLEEQKTLVERNEYVRISRNREFTEVSIRYPRGYVETFDWDDFEKRLEKAPFGLRTLKERQHVTVWVANWVDSAYFLHTGDLRVVLPDHERPARFDPVVGRVIPGGLVLA
jgi:hypothetical protein